MLKTAFFGKTDFNMELYYRKALKSDIDAVFLFVKAAVKNLEEKGIFQWDEIYPAKEDIASDIERGEAYVAEVLSETSGTNRLAAFFTLNTDCDEDYKNGEWKYNGTDFTVVHRLCVNPEFQHQGIGFNVVTHIIEEGRKKGLKAVRLDTFTKNPLSVHLYEKLGFYTVGTVDWRKGRFFLMEKTL